MKSGPSGQGAGGCVECKEVPCPITEQRLPLQCWNVGDCPRAAEAVARPEGLHAAHGPLHWEDDGPGEELRATDHSQKDINQVSVFRRLCWGQPLGGALSALVRVELQPSIMGYSGLSLLTAAFLPLCSSQKRPEVQADFCPDSQAGGQAQCFRPPLALPRLESEAGWRRGRRCRGRL